MLSVEQWPPGIAAYGSRLALDNRHAICIIHSMDLIEALDLIEGAEHAEEAYHEMLADLGSSYFMGGAQGNSGYDALHLARVELERTRDLDAEAEFDLAVAEARRVVAHYEAIAPGEPRRTRRLNPISDADEASAERRHNWRMDGDGMDAPEGFYR